MHLIRRQTCRVCGSSALARVIDLNEQYLQGSFVKEGSFPPPQRKIPTSLIRCDPMQDEKACGLLQMEYSVPPAILYSSYWYRSGTNQTMRDHLAQIVKEAIELVAKDKAVVLDIGCNDGTLLKSYPSHYRLYGIDPANATLDIGNNITVIRDLFPSQELSKVADGVTFDIITSIAMFYDLEDPVGFCQGIQKILAPDGLWVFEMSYMPAMLQMNSYDTICHEHLEYYSLAVIENILGRAGLKLINASLNNINGGSIRCFATHSNNFALKRGEHDNSLKKMRSDEFDLALETDIPYRDFQRRIEGHRTDLNKLLRDLKRKGKRIHIYGASTKGNTILQWCGIDHTIIEYAADRNPDKAGARTLGTDIPIISEAESRKLKPDYYLVLPWHFASEFLEREREMILNGTSLIFPLPEIHIIDKAHLQARP